MARSRGESLTSEPQRSHPPMRTSPIRPNSPVPCAPAPWRALLVAVLALATLLPPAPAPPAAAAGRPAGPLVPAGGFYVGAYTKHIDGYGRGRAASRPSSDLESRLGRRLHIDHHFYAWADEFPSWREPWDIENGRIPMISWNGENTDAIARGDQDGMIPARAQAVPGSSTPVFIRWFWEMDGNKKAGLHLRAGQLPEGLAAHRRPLPGRRAPPTPCGCGAPTPRPSTTATAMKYYPGAAYVDWVCGDGYNFAPNRPGDKWENFDEIFDGFYRPGHEAREADHDRRVRRAGDGNPGRKEQWFRQAHDWIGPVPGHRRPRVLQRRQHDQRRLLRLAGRHVTVESFEGFRYLFTGPAPVPRPLDADAQPRPPRPRSSDRDPAGHQAPKPAPPKPATPKPRDHPGRR